MHSLVCVVRQLTQGAGVCLQFVGPHITGAASSQGNNALTLIRSDDTACKRTDASTYGLRDANMSKNK